jgi:hypothetical protein
MDTTTIKAEVLVFADQHPTPQVQRMVALCYAGQITWAQAHEIARKALAAGLTAVAR